MSNPVLSVANAGYFKQLFEKAWSDTWSTVFNSPFISVLAAVFIFGISLLIHWQRKGVDDVKDALAVAVEGAAATIIVFAGFFAINLFFLTPKRLYEGVSEELKKVPKSEEPRIKLDVADEESRKEIGDLKKQLAVAEETIKKQQTARDPFSVPIASARFTLLLNFKSAKEAASNYFGSGAAVLLASAKETMLSGGVAQHISDGEGHSQVVIECPFDSPAIGKPIRSLAEAKFLALQFAAGFVPVDTELAPSRLVLLVNNQINLTFEIPGQTVAQKIVGAGGTDGTSIFLMDIRKGLAPLATQPSSTPDTGVSTP